MESKITLRDIFSYFLVGFYFLACLASTQLVFPMDSLGDTDGSKFLSLVMQASKEISSAVLLLVPLVYLIGVIVHGVDNMVQIAAWLPFKLWEKDYTSGWDGEIKSPKDIRMILVSLLAGSWIQLRDGFIGSQPDSGGDPVQGQGSVYWMIAFQANEGFYRVSWLYALYHLFFGHGWVEVSIFLFLVLLFWLRALVILREDLLRHSPDRKRW